MTRIEIELTDEQVRALQGKPDPFGIPIRMRIGSELCDLAAAALPPEPIRLEIELPADVVEVLSRTHWTVVGTIGEDARLALQRISAAAREHEAGR